MAQRVINQVLDRHYRLLLGQTHGRGRNHFGFRQLRVYEGAAQSILDEQLFQFQVRLSNDQRLLVSSDNALRPDYFDRRQSADFHLLLVIRQCFFREALRLFLHFHVFVSVYQVPIDVLDLIHGSDDLQTKSNIRDFTVILCNANKAAIRQKPKAQTISAATPSPGNWSSRSGSGTRT